MKKTPTPYTFSDTDILFTSDKVASTGDIADIYTRKGAVSAQNQTVVKEYPLKLRDLPEADKPREKLIEQGVAILSLQDLIAVVLQTGTKSEDVLSISKRVVREYGHSALVSQLDPTIPGKAERILKGSAFYPAQHREYTRCLWAG